MSESRSDDEWVAFYADQQGIYEAFVDNLERLLETLLVDGHIEFGYVLAFQRGLDAYDLVRARRAGQSIDNPLESPLRVAGVTVMVETPASVPEIVDLVRREFTVDLAGTLSIEEAAAGNDLLAGPNNLAYESPHYLVSLDERRLELAEWSRFAGLKVRIEVKTELQDAWERIDSDLPFYSATSYPPEVRDLLARSAHGLRAIDNDLVEAKDAIVRLLAEYEDAVAAGELQVPVNGVSLLAYVRTSELVRSLTELGEDVGLEHAPDYEPAWADIEHRVLWLLRSADVHTLAEFEDFLKQATPRARDMLTEFVRVATDQGYTPSALPESIVEWLWLVLRRADPETISMLRYWDEIEHALNTLIGNPTTRSANAS
ncbi:MAG: pyrophosphokinae [Gaiellaceae bacterium]|nr:pyrophosphokinae [Gaiellaceae bacterium]